MSALPISALGRALRLCQGLVDGDLDDDGRRELADAVTEVATGVEELGMESQELSVLAEQLERERERYREFFDAAPTTFVVTDSRGIVTEVNRFAVERLGVRVGQPLVLAVSREDRSRFLRQLGAPRSEGPALLACDARAGKRLLEVRGRTTEAGAVLWTLQDVTELELSRRRSDELAEQERVVGEQLRELDELRLTFIVAATHDLRTPIAAIAGLADTLVDQPDLPDADRRRAIEMIGSSARRAVELFSDLLDVDRLERREVMVRRESVDLAAVVARACKSVDLGGRTLEVDCPPQLVTIDVLLAERILENLLRNAAQHTPEGTHVWARAAKQRDGVLFVVEDDGPGIPADRASKVFEPFWRDRQPGVPEGLGIGLYLVRRFAELHGGYARVRPGRDAGVSFQVVLAEDDGEDVGER